MLYTDFQEKHLKVYIHNCLRIKSYILPRKTSHPYIATCNHVKLNHPCDSNKIISELHTLTYVA